MATSVNAGNHLEIVALAVTDGDYTALPLTHDSNNILIRAREADCDLYIKTDPALTDYFTVPYGQALTLDWRVSTGIPLYIKSQLASGTAEVISTYE